MDVAYDHIQESALSPEEAETTQNESGPSTLNKDFQDAYKAISSSPWGARLGGFFGSVVKQGEHIYKEAQEELSELGDEATKGFSQATKGFIDLRSSIMNRTRSLSLNQSSATEDSATEVLLDGGAAEKQDSAREQTTQESDSMLVTLRAEAAKRLKDIQRAEDAADEALLKFGTNIRNFLRDAVTIAPPAEGLGEQSGTVLFESKDAQGKRVIHTSRFDAQLHVIHSSLDSFRKDPDSGGYEPWAKSFDAETKTDDIGKDLNKYDELRSAMEKLVPHQVPYVDFWKRYYFLRHSIETAEERRRDLLKGAAASAEEEVGWDEESDEEGSGKAEIKTKVTPPRPSSVESSTTIQPRSSQPRPSHFKQSEPRKSNDEKSQADSDASYDVVGAASGAPSHAPGSPREARKGEDSEEEDWE